MFLKKDFFLDFNLIRDLVKFEVFITHIFKMAKLKNKEKDMLLF